ncbi:MAG TPA: sensor histidine kinase [Actinomycetota bacterium]|nr:sensor histidine kinase [Actinomycetota bacterium]
MGGRRAIGRRLETVDPRVVDAVVALGLAAIMLTELWTLRDEASTADLWWSAGFALVQTLPLSFRRRYPFTVFAVFGTASIVYDVLNLQPDPNTDLFAGLLAVYSVSAYASRRRAYAAAIILVVVLVVLNAPPITDEEDFASLLTQFALFGGAWVVGQNTRYRRREAELVAERAQAIERERLERDRVAALEERDRLAREIHDVIAHSVSVIAVQAGAARSIAEQRPDRAREALASIEQVSRETMVELRRALGAMGTPAETASLTPAPGLQALDALAETVRAAGVEVEIVREGDAGEIPASIDLSAYRIVQESLTNTVKHAAPTSAHVFIRTDRDRIEVSVSDDGPRTGTRPRDDPDRGMPSGGRGLVGMRQRVAMLGGTFEAGPDGAGFSVRALFPLRAMDGGP